MPKTTKSGLTRTLDQIAVLTEDALDPELSREDLVRSLKEIAEIAAGEDESLQATSRHAKPRASILWSR
jgi:hypothetical protein